MRRKEPFVNGDYCPIALVPEKPLLADGYSPGD